MIREPGIYTDMEPEEYFTDPCPLPSLTQSIAKILIEQSPAHAKLAHPRFVPPFPDDDADAEKYVAAQAIGNVAHAAMLGRGRRIANADFRDWKTKEARLYRDTAVQAGMIPILAKHAKHAERMVLAARDQLEAAGHGTAFRHGDAEVVLAWREGDIWLRTMIDWLHSETRVYDYKTTGLSVAPHIVIDRPSLEGWDIQAAMHERGLDALDPAGAGRRKFFYVNQENAPPYALTVVEISRHDLDLGRSKLEHAIEIWCRCVTSDTWPLYPAETITSHPRGWTETKWTERELEHRDRRRYEKPIDSLAGG